MSDGGSTDGGVDARATTERAPVEDDADGRDVGDAPGAPVDARVEPSTVTGAGVPATRRNRLKSAVLWGAVGGVAFLVLAQGYLLIGGELPFRYAWLFGVAGAVTVGATGVTYLAEWRIRAERSKRRT